MAKLYKALKTEEIFQVVEEKNNVVLLKNLTNPSIEDKPVFLTTLKRWYAELPPEEAEQYQNNVVEVETTAKAETETEAVETPKKESKPKTEKKEKKPREKATSIIEGMINEALEGTENYEIEDKFLSINGTKVLRILKDGVSIREAVAKDNGIEYEKKGYNHPFKAKVTADSVEAIKELLPKLIEPETEEEEQNAD